MNLSKVIICFTKSDEVWVMALIPPLSGPGGRDDSSLSSSNPHPPKWIRRPPAPRNAREREGRGPESERRGTGASEVRAPEGRWVRDEEGGKLG